MGSNEFLYLVQILLAQQDKKSAPFYAKRKDLKVTATIRIISTISPVLACNVPQQTIASMYKPHRAFCIASLTACLFKHDHSYAVSLPEYDQIPHLKYIHHLPNMKHTATVQ